MDVEARVTGLNTGGLELKFAGRRAFMPASQVGLHHVDDLVPFLNQTLHCRVIDVDRKSRNIVLSRRAVLLADQKVQRAQRLSTITEGQLCEGKVQNIQKFGVFVDIGGVDGLIHISDLSYRHVKHPSEVVQVGQTVQAKVLKVDAEAGRLTLGMRQMQPDPWEDIVSKYPPGKRTAARVIKLTRFGAFVELADGIEGLIPASEMSWTRTHDLRELVQEQQNVEAVVLATDLSKRHITLSMKQLEPDPWDELKSKHDPGDVVTGMVTRITSYGAFVELAPGLEGMIHISELSDRRVDKVDDVVKVGEPVTVRIIGIEEEKRRVGLSVKALNEADDKHRERSRGSAGRNEQAKYVVDPSKARAVQSLMDKSDGQGDGGLKGGIG